MTISFFTSLFHLLLTYPLNVLSISLFTLHGSQANQGLQALIFPTIWRLRRFSDTSSSLRCRTMPILRNVRKTTKRVRQSYENDQKTLQEHYHVKCQEMKSRHVYPAAPAHAQHKKWQARSSYRWKKIKFFNIDVPFAETIPSHFEVAGKGV